jgi:HEAT repeat protein
MPQTPAPGLAVLHLPDHPDADVRFAVAFALPSLDLDDEGLAALRKLSADPDADVRSWATFGLAGSDEATIDALVARAYDPDEDTRAEGIGGLARRRDPRAVALVDHERAGRATVGGSKRCWTCSGF